MTASRGIRTWNPERQADEFIADVFSLRPATSRFAKAARAMRASITWKAADHLVGNKLRGEIRVMGKGSDYVALQGDECHGEFEAR